MASDSPNWAALKGIALASTFAVASAQTTTSLFFIPSLLRPLNSTSLIRSRSSSSLQLPTTSSADGRLTPMPSESKGFTFNFNTGSSGTYKAVAQQFARFDIANFYVAVPLEITAFAIFSAAAYRARSAGQGVWTHWAAGAGLVASVFPFTGIMMAPLVHKLARIAGDEEKVEPYEDAPIDHDAEKSNTVEFLTQWSFLNAARAAVMFAASGVGLLAFVAA